MVARAAKEHGGDLDQPGQDGPTHKFNKAKNKSTNKTISEWRLATRKMLNAHFKSSGFNKNQLDLHVHIEPAVFPLPEVRDMKPGGGWFPWRRLLP